jgi:hypothetical protein
MKETTVETAKITNELLLALLNQLYSIELILADAYCGKANLRYSNAILEKDSEVLEQLTSLVEESLK